jgi:hypothetical protein
VLGETLASRPMRACSPTRRVRPLGRKSGSARWGGGVPVERYFTIVNLSDTGRERSSAVVAVITSV